MSWSDRARAVAALGALLGLGGCFTPLYSESAHPGVTEAMREVTVAPVATRLGHYLVDDLITDMNGSGATPSAKYRLTLSVSQSVVTPTVELQLAVATSATVIANAGLLLTKIEGGEVLYKGLATASAPYDRSLDNYANLRASRDAEIRCARALAEEIELRVAAALTAKS